MHKITPFLWFDNNAEEAMQFYMAIFDDARIDSVARYGKGGPGPEGALMTATFTLQGQSFIALNGGPQFTFSEAISFVITCRDQQEVDHYWNKLSEGGKPSRCGWLKDPFGLSWQVVPAVLPKLMSGGTAAQSARVVQAMLQMTKLDIVRLEAAFYGGASGGNEQ